MPFWLGRCEVREARVRLRAGRETSQPRLIDCCVTSTALALFTMDLRDGNCNSSIIELRYHFSWDPMSNCPKRKGSECATRFVTCYFAGLVVVIAGPTRLQQELAEFQTRQLTGRESSELLTVFDILSGAYSGSVPCPFLPGSLPPLVAGTLSHPKSALDRIAHQGPLGRLTQKLPRDTQASPPSSYCG